PDALIARYGADTVRLYTLFIGPPEKDAEWNDRGVEGSYRFLTRYWKMVEDFVEATGNGPGPVGTPKAGAAWAASGPARDLRRRIHEVAHQILEDMDRLHLNTAVSGLMQMVNAVQDYQTAGGSLDAPEAAEAVDMSTRLMAPLAPHTAEGAWQRLGHKESVFRAPWPKVAEEARARDSLSLVVQVNGKVRYQIQVAVGATQDAIRQTALADPKAGRFVEGKKVVQVIYVPGRLINIVVS
ncbi:MAG: class I tRNA ligase family protein, partial [Candidatus Eiseniibacteriota bacterium]